MHYNWKLAQFSISNAWIRHSEWMHNYLFLFILFLYINKCHFCMKSVVSITFAPLFSHKPLTVNKFDWIMKNKVRTVVFIVFFPYSPKIAKCLAFDIRKVIWNRKRKRERECDAKKEFLKYSNRFFMKWLHDSFFSFSRS